MGLRLKAFLLIAVSAFAYTILNLLVPPPHHMQNHIFTPGEADGGHLYYQGDVPILALDADRPFQAGKAQGYLLGDSLNRIFKRLDFMQHSVAGKPRADELSKTLERVKATIPVEYLEEMQGMLEGFRQWSSEHPFSFPKTMTLEDIILIHLMPDSMHFDPAGREKSNDALRFDKVACSVVIDRDENNDLIIARNMDWPSFGIMGRHSLIINRKHNDKGFSTVEVGIPGFLGTLTGMNSNGLALSMNVCPGSTKTVRGMPAAFFNRKCLENSNTVDHLQSFLRSEGQPLGPYHLTAIDPSEAASFHFYQSEDGEQFISRKKTQGSPFVVLNDRYGRSANGNSYVEKSVRDKRDVTLNAWFEYAETQNLPKSKAIADSLALPHVNNVFTTHSVLMNPSSKTMAVSLNNAYAAKYPRHTVATEELFSN